MCATHHETIDEAKLASHSDIYRCSMASVSMERQVYVNYPRTHLHPWEASVNKSPPRQGIHFQRSVTVSGLAEVKVSHL